MLQSRKLDAGRANQRDCKTRSWSSVPWKYKGCLLVSAEKKLQEKTIGIVRVEAATSTRTMRCMVNPLKKFTLWNKIWACSSETSSPCMFSNISPFLWHQLDSRRPRSKSAPVVFDLWWRQQAPLLMLLKSLLEIFGITRVKVSISSTV